MQSTHLARALLTASLKNNDFREVLIELPLLETITGLIRFNGSLNALLRCAILRSVIEIEEGCLSQITCFDHARCALTYFETAL